MLLPSSLRWCPSIAAVAGPLSSPLRRCPAATVAAVAEADAAAAAGGPRPLGRRPPSPLRWWPWCPSKAAMAGPSKAAVAEADAEAAAGGPWPLGRRPARVAMAEAKAEAVVGGPWPLGEATPSSSARYSATSFAGGRGGKRSSFGGAQ